MTNLQSQVVVDPTINPQYMEMYADEESRGGVLEPEGIVGIKYRKERQLETMARLDPTYGELKTRSLAKDLTAEQQNDIKRKMTERENLLLPVYLQISLQYADLHDRAGRMEAKGTIRMALQWAQARRFFYWRLRRRLNEEYVLRRIAGQQSKDLVNRDANLKTLEAWSSLPNYPTDDKAVAVWFEENRKSIADKIEAIKADAVAYDVATLMRSNKTGGLKGVAQVLSMLPVNEKEEVLKWLARA
jgi:acetyl-CoA carboxylase/biotin carboxylase 1